MKNDGRKIYTVSELNREIRVVMEDTWPDIWLEGEVSNFRAYPSGHWYLKTKMRRYLQLCLQASTVC